MPPKRAKKVLRAKKPRSRARHRQGKAVAEPKNHNDAQVNFKSDSLQGIVVMASSNPTPGGASNATVPAAAVGPHPSYIQVAKPFIFQQQLQNQLVAIGTNPTREDAFRLQGVQWINEIRTALQLPIRTFCTAVIYYHKFRLNHKDTEYQYQDASAAALLTACKIEDTLKKSREILCAAYNYKVPVAEHLSPDDSTFETPSKIIIGLERLMLESSGFDFRNRYPQKHLVKLVSYIKLDRDIGKAAYSILIDLYRTFAPIKQSSSTMCFAVVELATLLSERQHNLIRGEGAPQYKKWSTSRPQVLETIMDLLDLYTHFQKNTIIGPLHHIDKFIQIQLQIKSELDTHKVSRYTEYHDPQKQPANGRLGTKTPKTPITPASPADALNGPVISPTSPRSAGSGKRGSAGRSQEGTVRFMLDNEQARKEKDTVSEYFKVEYEEYEVEVEEPIKPEREERAPRNNHHHHHHHHNNFHRGREDRGYYRGSRGGRRQAF